ncbi:hypothetical protein MKW92_038907 [Papaver armeniacum]|nr:hypothetical protein MKW92_038907 [Papaver armeniacum]
MSRDKGQVLPEQQQQQRKPHKRKHKNKSLQDKTSKDQRQTHTKQQESATIIEKKDQPTWEGLVGAHLYWITVPKLSKYGAIEEYLIPTRSHWLKIVGDDWGTTDDKIKACIKTCKPQKFRIEVCGWYMGYGVIVRDRMRNPIIVISKGVLDDYVSPFYHELQGVSLGLKLAMKYGIVQFDFNCVSESVYSYVVRTWNHKYDCDCPPRDNPMNPRKKKHYCVECSASILNEVRERKNAYKILPLIDEIFYDALEFASEGYIDLYLFPIEKSRVKAAWHLANSGIDQELRIHEKEDEEIADILYREVFGHGSMQEVVLLQRKLMLQKQELRLWKLRNRAEERAYQESLLENGKA